ncbi:MULTISPECIES: DUF402 domain-containing protein [Cohnella]|uniref:DUF402 domain-containing protein n=1 Tax=Cohnella phaseoli TaxID=456490 RepID=A0A3D9INQ3_9BACL|nr:DUF402 domain-containing protein [Cohnella phaseoli]RED63361.1 hypothetical protein DFP98_12637 [Cohnella phaseoli]
MTESADGRYMRCVIKSFKHDGSLHRVWLENWQVPADRLLPGLDSRTVWVLINEHTTVQESNGREWSSRVPAVTYFFPERWYNVVALLEEEGVRYYCNLASPPYRYGDVLTYIDYDLDVVVLADGTAMELDRDEYDAHKATYRYGEAVEERVEAELLALRKDIEAGEFPFDDSTARLFYQQWKEQMKAEGGTQAT